MEIARVRNRGRVTIPQVIREEYGLVTGTNLEFIVTGPSTFECLVIAPIGAEADQAVARSADEHVLRQETRGAE